MGKQKRKAQPDGCIGARGLRHAHWRAVLGVALLTTACSRDIPGQATFSLDQCNRVAPLMKGEPPDARPLVGAEDMIYDARRNRVIFSAYDRRAAEAMSRRSGASPREGGLYAIDLDALFEDAAPPVRALVDGSMVTGGLRPHGIDYDTVNDRLLFINRSYERTGARWRLSPRLYVVDDGAVTEERMVHCAANDAAFIDGEIIFSIDHARCGFGALVDDILALKEGGLRRLDGTHIAGGVGFANGVVAVGGEIYLAATRENAVRRYGARGARYGHDASIFTPGAPDNLTRADDGRLVIAVHASLIRLAMNRKLGRGRAPSRIIAVDPEGGAVELLFDDPEGALFSAATVGVLTPRGLVAGSVTDEGLLICPAVEEEAA